MHEPIAEQRCGSDSRRGRDPVALGDRQVVSQLVTERDVVGRASSVVVGDQHDPTCRDVRSNRSGIKVGGHQASSTSIASIMTALYFTGVTKAKAVRRTRVAYHAVSGRPARHSAAATRTTATEIPPSVLTVRIR